MSYTPYFLLLNWVSIHVSTDDDKEKYDNMRYVCHTSKKLNLAHSLLSKKQKDQPEKSPQFSGNRCGLYLLELFYLEDKLIDQGSHTSIQNTISPLFH